MPALRTLLASLVLAAAIWLAWQWWSDPRRAIARRLDGVADALSAPAVEGQLDRFARAARLSGYFAPDVRVSAGRSGPSMASRDALLATLAAWKGPAGGWDVQVADVEVTMESVTTAHAHMTVRIAGVEPQTGARSFDAREVAARLAKADGEWVITGAELVETLQQP
jgi:hypothetical protein